MSDLHDRQMRMLQALGEIAEEDGAAEALLELVLAMVKRKHAASPGTKVVPLVSDDWPLDQRVIREAVDLGQRLAESSLYGYAPAVPSKQFKRGEDRQVKPASFAETVRIVMDDGRSARLPPFELLTVLLLEAVSWAQEEMDWSLVVTSVLWALELATNPSCRRSDGTLIP